MKAFFSNLTCCARRKPKDECLQRTCPQAVIDDRTRLIPPAVDGPSIVSYDATTVDHQKARERLNVIVRSKEGKMVNVLSRVPFNLRNDPLSAELNASSSRSNRSPSANLNHPHNRTLDLNGLDASRTSSPKPSPSMSRSESASSIHQASVSHVSITDDVFEREPILRARLVPTLKSSQRALSRRGRSKTRQGRFLEDGDPMNNAPTLEGIQSIDSGRGDVDIQGSRGDWDGSSELPSVAVGVGKPEVTPLSEEDQDIIKAISEDLSSTLREGFKLQDVGNIARSWGD